MACRASRANVSFRLSLRRTRRRVGPGEPLAKLNAVRLLVVLCGLHLAVMGGGCAADLPKPDGACTVAPAMDCTVAPDDGLPAQDVGLIGYACTGTARPDDT